MTTAAQPKRPAGACTLCDVVKPDDRALRDHVSNVHPNDFCALYHQQPCQHDRRRRYDMAIDRALRDSGVPPEARSIVGRAVSDAAMARADAEIIAVLRAAADMAESLRQFEPATGPRKSAQVSENVGVLRVAEWLRGLADTAQYADDSEMASSLRRDGFGPDEIANMLRPANPQQPTTDTPPPVVMPHDRDEYDRMRNANPRPGPCCQRSGPVPHWPMWAHCGGGNAPGKPIRPHCTCDACF